MYIYIYFYFGVYASLPPYAVCKIKLKKNNKNHEENGENIYQNFKK